MCELSQQRLDQCQWLRRQAGQQDALELPSTRAASRPSSKASPQGLTPWTGSSDTYRHHLLLLPRPHWAFPGIQTLAVLLSTCDTHVGTWYQV